MEKGKITEIGIKYNYGFYNGGFIKFIIGKIEHSWYSTDRVIEAFCVELGIKKEDDMQKLFRKRFNVLDKYEYEDGTMKFLIEIIDKRLNPNRKSIWFYNECY